MCVVLLTCTAIRADTQQLGSNIAIDGEDLIPCMFPFFFHPEEDKSAIGQAFKCGVNTFMASQSYLLF